MSVPREIQFQNSITEMLERNNLNPFSVICTFGLGNNEGFVAVTFYIEHDLKELLDLLDYQSQCDKTAFLVIGESNTVILSGMGLLTLYTLL